VIFGTALISLPYPLENILQLYTLPGNSKEAMKTAPWKSDILLGSPGISKHFNSLEFPYFIAIPPGKYLTIVYPPWKFQGGNEKSPLEK
jgi:hypothetical protein